MLQLFFDHQLVPGVDWPQVIKRFGEEIPSIAGGINDLLDKEQKTNPNFRERFAAFAELCRVSINLRRSVVACVAFRVCSYAEKILMVARKTLKVCRHRPSDLF